MAEIRWDMLAGLPGTFFASADAARKRAEEDRATELLKLYAANAFDQPESRAQQLLSIGQPAAPAAAGPNLPAFAGGGAAMRTPADPAAEKRFIDTMRAGGLTNPNALAAFAAYANAESGYKPGNITGSWSDPSESGQAGTSGGILSWRGSRLANMRTATQGAADPVVAQAQFALTENPDLTVALQNAKSPDEAHQLLANAWRFAGFNRPGGENQRRLEMTRAYLDKVNGPAQVASADLPASDAQPAEFVVPPKPAAPATATPMGRPTPAQPAAPAISPQRQAALLEMLGNPHTRALATQEIQRLTNPQYGFQTAGDTLYRTNPKTGTAEPITQVEKPTDVQRDYAAAVKQGYTGSLIDFDMARRRAGATNVSIDQKGETAFTTTANTAVAKRFEKLSEEGDSGRGDLAALAQIRALGGAIDQNSLPALRARLAEYGIKIGDDIGAIQAFESLVDKMVPQQRVPGSGTTSDFDVKTFKSSLPRLMNTPDGNALITGTLEALAQDKMARAAIAEKALTGELKPADAIRELRALPNPDLAFKSGLSELGKSGKLAATAPVQGQGASRPQRVSKEQYDALPSGASYIAPDGSLRTKK